MPPSGGARISPGTSRPSACVYLVRGRHGLQRVVTFANHGISASTGWYFYAVLRAGMLLIARRDVLLIAGIAFAALDLYAMNFVALP